MKGKLSKIRPQGHRAKSRTSEYHCHDWPNERAGLLWQAQRLQPLLLKIESTVPKHFHLEAIGFPVLAKLLRTSNQKLSSHDAKWFLLPWHAIIMYTSTSGSEWTPRLVHSRENSLEEADIQLIYNSGQPFPHTWETISHRAFLSCCLFLTQVSNALAGEFSIPVVALGAGTRKPVYFCHHPNAEAQRTCVLEARQLLWLPGGKRN